MRKVLVAALCLAFLLPWAIKVEAQGSSRPNPTPQPGAKGLTWQLLATNPTSGTIDVGCGPSCNAYQGDTPCTTALPLLCIKKSGAGFPLPLPTSVTSSQYHTWSGGIVGTTSPMVPPSTLVAADAVCAQAFGAGWRVIEFHDGWGWNLQAYGGLGNPASRVWIHINDQPSTCWH